MVKGINVVFCPVADAERALDFYVGVLGAQPGARSRHWSDCRVGGLRIGFHPPKDQEPVGGWLLCLEAEDVPALRKRLVEAGVWVAEEYHDTPSGAVLDFNDLDGNRLQALQAGVVAKDLPPF